MLLLVRRSRKRNSNRRRCRPVATDPCASGAKLINGGRAVVAYAMLCVEVRLFARAHLRESAVFSLTGNLASASSAKKACPSVVKRGCVIQVQRPPATLRGGRVDFVTPTCSHRRYQAMKQESEEASWPPRCLRRCLVANAIRQSRCPKSPDLRQPACRLPWCLPRLPRTASRTSSRRRSRARSRLVTSAGCRSR